MKKFVRHLVVIPWIPPCVPRGIEATCRRKCRSMLWLRTKAAGYAAGGTLGSRWAGIWNRITEMRHRLRPMSFVPGLSPRGEMREKESDKVLISSLVMMLGILWVAMSQVACVLCFAFEGCVESLGTTTSRPRSDLWQGIIGFDESSEEGGTGLDTGLSDRPVAAGQGDNYRAIRNEPRCCGKCRSDSNRGEWT